MSYGVMTRRGFAAFRPAPRFRRRGMGFTYYDLLAQANLQACDPHNAECVASNEEKQAAVEDLWVSKYMTHPDTANQPAPQITVSADTSKQTMNQFLADQPIEGTITFPSQPNADPIFRPAPPVVTSTPAKPVTVAGTPVGPNAPAPGTPGGAKVTSSNGAQSGNVPPGTDHPCMSIIGWQNDIGSCIGPFTVTTWGILAAIGIGLYAFGGRRGR